MDGAPRMLQVVLTSWIQAVSAWASFSASFCPFSEPGFSSYRVAVPFVHPPSCFSRVLPVSGLDKHRAPCFPPLPTQAALSHSIPHSGRLGIGRMTDPRLGQMSRLIRPHAPHARRRTGVPGRATVPGGAILGREQALGHQIDANQYSFRIIGRWTRKAYSMTTPQPSTSPWPGWVALVATGRSQRSQ